MRIILIAICFSLFSDRSFSALPESGDTSHINAILQQSFEKLNDDPDSAFYLAKTGFQLSQQAGFEPGIAKAFMRIGAVYQSRGLNDSALLFYFQALRIRKKLNDFYGASGACVQLSEVYKSGGKKDSAYYFLFDALRLVSHINHTEEKVYIYLRLANLSAEYKMYQKSYTYIQTALNTAGRIKDTSLMIMSASALGNFYYQQNKFDSALTWFIQSLALSTQSNNETFLAGDMNNVALCYDALSRFDKASLYYHRALHFYTTAVLQHDIALVYSNLGNMFMNAGKPDSALFYLNKSLALFREMGDNETAALCLQRLAETHAMKNDFLKAYGYYVQYSELSDSLLNDEKIRQIASMQTLYETEKKEQQITLLAEQNKTRSAQRNFFIAGSIVLLLGLFVLGIYYVQRNRINKKNAQIAEQKISSLLNEQEIKTYNAMIDGQEEERKRIAGDLHDRLGSMLSTVKLLFSALDDKMDKAQEENKMQYERAGMLLDEAVAEVRRISHNLSTGMVISFGLVTALQELTESINQSGMIQCKLLTYGKKERLDQQTEIGIYRMIQELISNILKHAKASVITIQLNQMDTTVSVSVEDNGIGFNVAEKIKSGGLGLKNLEARAAKLNGSFYVDSQPGKGTLSVIEIPIQTI